jgi:hypothetical protein
MKLLSLKPLIAMNLGLNDNGRIKRLLLEVFSYNLLILQSLKGWSVQGVAKFGRGDYGSKPL